MPCPHFKVTIAKRSEGKSAVAGAAYQSGENLYSDYDQKWKNYKSTKEKEVFYKEILLSANAPPEYADRTKLWNAVEAKENQWNSQLARRIVMAIPKEVPEDQHIAMVREYCDKQFVSRGMIADVAIHNKGDGNPHAHIMLTMRSLDAEGKWLPKCRKVYDLDEEGNKIRLSSGAWKSHREDVNDWNSIDNAEIWRKAWADIQNKYLKLNNRAERADLRSYARQGIDQVPTVHMGPAAWQMEQRGIETDVGNLNREIKALNSLMAMFRNAIRSLKAWLTELRETKKELTAVISDRQNSMLIDILYRYMEMRETEREGWSGKAQMQGMAKDFEKVEHAVSYLKDHDIVTIDDLNEHLSKLEETAKTHNARIRKNDKRYKVIENIQSRYAVYCKYKPIFETYTKKNFKFTKEKYYNEHMTEIDEYRKAIRYLKANHGEDLVVKKGEFDAEIRERKAQDTESGKVLSVINTDLQELKSVRCFVNKVLDQERAEEQKKLVQELQMKEIPQKPAQPSRKKKKKHDMSL